VDYVRVYERVAGIAATQPRGKGVLPYSKKKP
jgi:hypothetical protein